MIMLNQKFILQVQITDQRADATRRKTYGTIELRQGWKGNGENKQAFTKNMSFILLALKLYYHMSGQ